MTNRVFPNSRDCLSSILIQYFFVFRNGYHTFSQMVLPPLP